MGIKLDGPIDTTGKDAATVRAMQDRQRDMVERQAAAKAQLQAQVDAKKVRWVGPLGWSVGSVRWVGPLGGPLGEESNPRRCRALSIHAVHAPHHITPRHTTPHHTTPHPNHEPPPNNS